MYLIVYGNSDQDPHWWARNKRTIPCDNGTYSICFNPLYSNGFFLLVCCIYLRIVHCIYRGITGYKFQIKIVFLSLEIVFVFAKCADTDYAAFHLGRHCLPKYPFCWLANSGPFLYVYWVLPSSFGWPSFELFRLLYLQTIKNKMSFLFVRHLRVLLLSCDFPQIFVLLSTQYFLFKYGIAVCR